MELPNVVVRRFVTGTANDEPQQDEPEVALKTTASHLEHKLETLRRLRSANGEFAAASVNDDDRRNSSPRHRPFRREIRKRWSAVYKESGLLWASDIKSIEGRYGSGVGTYFRLLRSLFFLNLVVGVLIFSFITSPQIATERQDAGVDFRPEDILTGKGWLSSSVLYYGAHSSSALGKIQYRMDEAYFYIMSCCYVLSFLIVCVRTAKSYRKAFIDSTAAVANSRSKMVFAGWDFSITDDETAKTYRSIIRSQIIESVELRKPEAAAEAKNAGRFRSTDFTRFVLNVAVWVFVLCIILFCGFLGNAVIARLLQTPDDDKTLWEEMSVSILITSLIFALPQLFALLGQYGDVRTRNNLDLVRTFLLVATVHVVVALSYFAKSDGSKTPCWENEVGYEMYRLLLLSPFFLVLLPAVLRAVRSFARSRTRRIIDLGVPKFNLGLCTVYLIHGQTCIWMGQYFCPLLPLIGCLVLVLTFYVTKFSLHSVIVSSSPYRAAQSLPTFLGLSSVCLLGALFAFIYVTNQLKASDGCGPFQTHEYPVDILTGSAIFNTGLSKVVLLPGTPVAIYVTQL